MKERQATELILLLKQVTSTSNDMKSQIHTNTFHTHILEHETYTMFHNYTIGSKLRTIAS